MIDSDEGRGQRGRAAGSVLPRPPPPEPSQPDAPSDRPLSALPPELEARIAALETMAVPADFDSLSRIWIILFGILLPVLLIIVGWWL
ncbi:MAG TPA: hypothetical protein VK437_04540 [Steroidobacteraceae bacterium]|nr:hypothetical protein [Steroidobacteraceae bacterium]